MLRELYTTVANGASFFSPGYWFHGVRDERDGQRADITAIEDDVGDGSRTFDLETIELLRAHPGSYVVYGGIPTGFVALTHIGCGIYVYLDGLTGHLYIRDQLYENGEFVSGIFSFCALSLEEWVERKLAQSPVITSEDTKYLPHYALAMIQANTSETTDTGGGKTTPMNGRSPERSMPIRTHNATNPREHLRLRLRLRLQSVREDIVRQISELDDIWTSSQKSGNTLTDEIARCEAIQRLADAEAQIYALEDDLRFPN